MPRNIKGILLTLLAPAAWRSYFASRQGQAFDRRFGTDTRDKMSVSEMSGVDRELASHAVQYEASAIPKFRRALDVVRGLIGDALHEYTFIDFGSGKGLAVMLASQLPFKKICGVEMTPALHLIAESNVRKFAAQAAVRAPVSLTCSDALTYALPEGNIVAYLYNPFDETLTARLIERLTRQTNGSARSLIVIYINPVHSSLFENDTHFRRVYEHYTLAVYELVQSAVTAEMALS